MIMKQLMQSAVVVIVCGWLNAQAAVPATWNVEFKAVDESGLPVADAEAWVAFGIAQYPERSNKWDKVEGLTDANGVFRASHEDTHSMSLGLHLRKAGYYPTDVVYELGPSYDEAKWNPALTLPLKKVGRPIPMYAKWLNVGMPAFDKPIRFDLTAGDWVAPYGKGTKTDIIFTAHRDMRGDDDFDFKLTVGFPNKGDGIQPFSPNTFRPGQGSALRSPHEAPDAGYQAEWIKEQSRRPGEPAEYGLDENLNFFFRVRTILDEHGKVKSALYGKIYGDFMHFRYYLNPTPNDRNVEFDPKQDLLKGLRGSHVVGAP